MAELQDQGVRLNLVQIPSGERLAFVSPNATHGVLLQLIER